MDKEESITEPLAPVDTASEAPPSDHTAIPVEPVAQTVIAPTDAKSNPVVAAVLKSFAQLYTSTDPAEQVPHQHFTA